MRSGYMEIEIYEFETYEVAIFAYMVMENMQIRPYFVNPHGNTFNK